MTLVCVCVCVCVRERERGRDGEDEEGEDQKKKKKDAVWKWGRDATAVSGGEWRFPQTVRKRTEMARCVKEREDGVRKSVCVRLVERRG